MTTAETASFTDEAIAAAVQKGNIDMFGELMQRYDTKLKRYGRKFLSRDDDIEDVIQDVFIKVYENIQSFDTSLRFSPWIYRIAHNVFVNELKRKSRYGFAALDPEVFLPLLPARETADDLAIADELKDELETLLQTLSAKYREVIVLHYLEELTYQEISDILQISVSAVGVRIMRARKKLQATANTRNR